MKHKKYGKQVVKLDASMKKLHEAHDAFINLHDSFPDDEAREKGAKKLQKAADKMHKQSSGIIGILEKIGEHINL